MEIEYIFISAAITIVSLILLIVSIHSYRIYKNPKLPFVFYSGSPNEAEITRNSLQQPTSVREVHAKENEMSFLQILKMGACVPLSG